MSNRPKASTKDVTDLIHEGQSLHEFMGNRISEVFGDELRFPNPKDATKAWAEIDLCWEEQLGGNGESYRVHFNVARLSGTDGDWTIEGITKIRPIEFKKGRDNSQKNDSGKYRKKDLCAVLGCKNDVEEYWAFSPEGMMICEDCKCKYGTEDQRIPNAPKAVYK